MNVARLANIAQRVIDVAAVKSKQLEEMVAAKKLEGITRAAERLLQGNGEDEDLERLLEGIGRL